jgi:hypothetical protein
MSFTDDGRDEHTSSTDGTMDRTSSVSGSGSGPGTRIATPTADMETFAEDDPTRFESERVRKATLNEGIKKFNFKPKRVRNFLDPELIPNSDLSNFVIYSCPNFFRVGILSTRYRASNISWRKVSSPVRRPLIFLHFWRRRMGLARQLSENISVKGKFLN